MSLTSLFVSPRDPQSSPDPIAVEEVLNQLGIIATAIAPATFLAGPAFSQHVVYAGCAPHLVMLPPEEGSLQFCHVVIHGPFDRPRLVTGPNTVKPRCPQCRARFVAWKQDLDTGETADRTVPCGHCGAINAVADLDWRQHAVAARMMLELRNVFPGEASPSDTLMNRLEQATGETWRYAWARLLAITAKT
jgi:hypothetical protein